MDAETKRQADLKLAYEGLRLAAERVLLDVDDDGVAEAHDVAVHDLRLALARVNELSENSM